jgi:uncharacterized protein with PIN domain
VGSWARIELLGSAGAEGNEMVGSVVTVTLEVPDDLRFLLHCSQRRGTVRIVAAESDTVGHVVQAAGIPLTEVGAILRDREPVPCSERAGDGVLLLKSTDRPQPTPTWPPRFLLDVHLGGLARYLRILGVDAAYERDADDPILVARARQECRVLLSQDRGLLRRRTLPAGALVRGAGTADQLHDVLDRFAPPLAPWTRCARCNGLLRSTSLDEVASEVKPGTRRTYQEFARCCDCGQIYWPGAHRARLDRVVEHARDVVAGRRPAWPASAPMSG